MGYQWVIGVILGTFASIISNLGLNLQKLSHIRLKDKSEEDKKSYFKQPIWVLGISLVILGSLADFVALGFGAQSVIAPLGSFFFSFNNLLIDLTDFN